MKKILYTEEKVVPQTAIDDLGHVNNVVYLDWVQEVSQKHWESRTNISQRKKVFWVVLSHYIEYKSPAFEGETLKLQTWVETMKGVRSERHVEIRRTSDDQLIAKAKTIWCLVDAETKRPKRISDELDAVFMS